MAIVRRGLYRVNVLPTDATELIVRKGRVLLADSQTKVKGGKKLIFSGSSFLIANLEKSDKENLDSLDVWSKQRAETVAQANKRISSRDLTLFMASVNDDWYGRRSLFGRSSGFWVFNGRFGCYTFMPLQYGWGSPYGRTYPNAFYGGLPSWGGVRHGGRFGNDASTGVSSMPSPNVGGNGGTSMPGPSMNSPSMNSPSHGPATRSLSPHDGGVSRKREPML
jgi:hypothetical protein